MLRSNRRTLLALGAATFTTFGGGVAYRTGRFGAPVRRTPDLTDARLDITASDAKRSNKPRVLVIGNSATIHAQFFDRLRQEAGGEVHLARASANGARLVQSLRISRLRKLVREVNWDAVVLQDFSSTPLHPADRLGSRIAISQFAHLAGAVPIVLFPHWPSASGHHVYRGGLGSGFSIPDNPGDYANRAEAHYQRCANHVNGMLAPVLNDWMAALDRGEPLYDQDRHHASSAGARLAAAALWPAIQSALGECRPSDLAAC
ncbi:MAG: hypothetical protein AAFO72_05035 [Pseudomonadota bacterium]